MYHISIEVQKHKWKFGRTRYAVACYQAHIWGHTRERQRANIKWRGDSAERRLVRTRE